MVDPHVATVIIVGEMEAELWVATKILNAFLSVFPFAFVALPGGLPHLAVIRPNASSAGVRTATRIPRALIRPRVPDAEKAERFPLCTTCLLTNAACIQGAYAKIVSPSIGARG